MSTSQSLTTSPAGGKTLTRYSPGSLAELSTISLPLMLSALSGTFMLFVDRIMLAHYSASAMNAAATAWVIFSMFQFGTVSIAGIAEVFVGQSNGARQYQDLARPVWQMIWFSLLTLVPFVALGFLIPDWVLPPEALLDGKGFLAWLMFFGPLFPLNAALAAFYIGQGKLKLVVGAILISSLINFVLNFILIFGFDPWIPELGAKGSAIATGIGQGVNAIILFIAFMRPLARRLYHTHHYHFELPLFIKCLKIGFPNAGAHMVSIAGWAYVMSILSHVSFAHITIFTINQSIWLLMSFIIDGIHKAVTAVCANFIGARDFAPIQKVFNAGIKLLLCIIGVLIIPFIFFPDYLLGMFFSDELIKLDPTIPPLAYISCKWILVAFLCDGITWVIAGILTAAGDTRFILVAVAINSWLFGVLPFYLVMNYCDVDPTASIYLLCVFTFINTLCFYVRYRNRAWQPKALLPNPQPYNLI